MCAILKLAWMLKGIQKQLIKQFHPFFPILFGNIVSIKLLEFTKVCVEVFACYLFVHHYFLKLVVLDLKPQVVFAFDAQTF